MPSIEFEIDIVGPKPDQVPALDLAEFIQEFAKAVLSMEEGTDEGTATAAVSLVKISDGSDRLTFATTERYIAGVARLAASVKQRKYTRLPFTAQDALHKMSQVTKRRQWGIRIRPNVKLGIVTATVKKGDEIPAPQQPAAMKGTTTLLAKVIRTGGVQPRAELRLPNRSDLLYVDVTESIAKLLAGRLYDDVALEGIAMWDPETWKLKSFSVSRIVDFGAKSPATAFSELAAVAPRAWDGVDAVEYTRLAREGEGDMR